MLDPSGDSVRDSHSPIKLERALLPSHSGSYREQACTLSGYPSTISRRTEVFRHVFPRSRHVSSASQSIASTARSRNPNTGPVPSDASPKRREVFHKAITSFFHGTHSRDGTSRLVPLVARSSASSYQSIGDPESIRGSFPSLDLVSPDAFCFSGPSLGSLSVSVDTSMSRQPCVTKNGSDSGSNYGVRSESVSAKNSLLGDAILEPSVDSSRFCNISDMLSSTDTTSEESSFYMLRTKDQNLQSVPCEENTNKFARSTAFDTRGVDGFKLGLNNTSRIVSRAPSRPPSPNFPVSHRIPHEILMLIYENLGPRDFNSARHTCHIWLEASLDRKILLKMLHRGGWADSENSEPGHQDFPGSESILTKSVPGTWSLSRRLTRECAMLSNRIPDGLIQSAPLFVNRFNVDFTELGNGAMGKFRHPAGGKSAGLLFSISVCGKYLLVARDTMIYVYKLRGSDMVALSTIMCPRRVLSMAMDASSGRNAVAALLECRMGMICELQLDDAQQVESLCDTNVESLRDQCQPRTGIPSDTREANGLQSETSKVFNSIHVSRENGSHSTVDDEDVFESIKVQSNRHALTLQATNNPQTHEQNYINHTWNMRLRGLRRGSSVGSHSPAAHMCSGTIPMETSTSTFYRHLCSEEDPPRSVSICPQRLCVAFGCSAGVELHWVDALTGQSLSRWFPLTAPSDYLYFLAPRPGFESAKKLRLISSAAHPDHRPAIRQSFFSNRPTSGSFGSYFKFDFNLYRNYLPSCDHYRAVPLSDGHHVLFTDPRTGSLFVSCDAPFDGPTKLMPKVLFIPPLANTQTPRLYNSAFDMSRGARVVVAFGDAIFLYSIPPDVCSLSRKEQKAESPDIYSNPPFSREGRPLDHWLNWLEEPRMTGDEGSHPVWPIAMHGTKIATLRDICELAIHTDPDLTIWAFTMDAKCEVWQLRNSVDSAMSWNHYVCQNGLVHRARTVGRAGNHKDHHTLSPPPHASPPSMPHSKYESTSEHLGGLDGHCPEILSVRKSKRTGIHLPPHTIPRALSVENDDGISYLDVRGHDAWYQQNGDVILVSHNSRA